MRNRRMSGASETCTCDACMAPHLPKIVAKVVANQPISLVLPAFPGKSPNLAKVLGTLPDMAEENALRFLQQLADRIGKIYAPGAQIVLASDGRIFSDVVGLKDEDVTAYRDALLAMINDLGLANISTFNLEEIYEGLSFDEMRAATMADFSQSMDDLRVAVKRAQTPEGTADDVELNRLYCGITRFLVEDATFPGQPLSRNQIQKDARTRAYGVIQRSNAWSGVVEKHFPEAVRLSIHPHGCGSAKLGIHLSEPAQADNWITPWHGVALELEAGRFVLAKRAQAEALGATIVERDGRPSHFTLVG
jgi:pyoverdine/dityrosine biosynthesis protein Dit1